MPREATAAYDAIDGTKADLLRLICEHHRQPAIAERLGVSRSTVKRYVAELEAVVGCDDMLELARWWEANRAAWVLRQAERAGVRLGERRAGGGPSERA